MRLVLTTAPFDLFKEGYGTKKRIKRGHVPPLGIGYIAASAIEAGIETFLVDAPALGLSFEESRDMISEYKPDVVGISTLTASEEQSRKLAEILKRDLKVAVIMGGPHATCYPEEILRDSTNIDYVVMGEGEKTIAPLLEHIRKGTKPYDLKGVAFREKDSIINNGKSEVEYDIDNIKPPAMHLYRHELYSPLPYAFRRLPATSMITSRGCPYSKCAFCFSAGKMKKRYRRHSPGRVVDEIINLMNSYGVKEVMFCDDNFLFNRKWIKEFCGLIKEKKIDLSWTCAGRSDTVDPEMLKEVRSAGCWSVFYGLESGVQRLLDIIKKGVTVEEIRNSVKWTHEAGLETRGSFMLALPDETPLDARKTIDFAVSLDLDYALFHATFPDPGTELCDLAATYGKVRSYRGMSKGTFIPDGYKDAEEIEKMTSLGYRKFYFRPGYVIKRLRAIKNPSDLFRLIEGFLFLKGMP